MENSNATTIATTPSTTVVRVNAECSNSRDNGQKDVPYVGRLGVINGVTHIDMNGPSAFVPTGSGHRPPSHGLIGRVGLNAMSAFTPLVRLRNIVAGGPYFPAAAALASAATAASATNAASPSPTTPFISVSQSRLNADENLAADERTTVSAGGSCVPRSELIREPSGCGTSSRSKGSTPEVPADDVHAESPASPYDDLRSLRQRRKRSTHPDEQVSCPVCGITLRPSEMRSHFSVEVDRLEKLYKNPSKRNAAAAAASGSNVRMSSLRSSPPPSTASSMRLETYRRLKQNRIGRLGNACKGKGKGRQQDVVCPVCSVHLSAGASEEELSEHVEQCLRTAESDRSSGPEEDSAAAEPEYEEYSWAGERRIRTTSLLPGGSLASCGFQVASRSKPAADEEEDLVVDGDDDWFGASQYSEADVIPCASEHPTEDKEREALRDAVLSGSRGGQPVSEREQPACSKWSSPDKCVQASSKNREADDDNFKCLICMERYTKPLVSVQCWHVLCEECWLRALGAKKLCPQCNSITSPSHLRRIYL